MRPERVQGSSRTVGVGAVQGQRRLHRRGVQVLGEHDHVRLPAVVQQQDLPVPRDGVMHLRKRDTGSMTGWGQGLVCSLQSALLQDVSASTQLRPHLMLAAGNAPQPEPRSLLGSMDH